MRAELEPTTQIIVSEQGAHQEKTMPLDPNIVQVMQPLSQEHLAFIGSLKGRVEKAFSNYFYFARKQELTVTMEGLISLHDDGAISLKEANAGDKSKKNRAVKAALKSLRNKIKPQGLIIYSELFKDPNDNRYKNFFVLLTVEEKEALDSLGHKDGNQSLDVQNREKEFLPAVDISEEVSFTLPDNTVVIFKGKGREKQVSVLQALVKAREKGEGVTTEELVKNLYANILHKDPLTRVLTRVRNDILAIRLTLQTSDWEVLNITPPGEAHKGIKAVYFLGNKFDESAAKPAPSQRTSFTRTPFGNPIGRAAEELPQREVGSKKTPEETIAYSAAFKVLSGLLDGTLGNVATNSRIILDHAMKEIDFNYITLDTLLNVNVNDNENSLKRLNRFLSNAIISAAEEGFNPANTESEDTIQDRITQVCQQLKDKGYNLKSAIQETHRALGLKIPGRYS